MNHEGHAVALITGDSTTDQRITVLNRFVERERERERVSENREKECP